MLAVNRCRRKQTANLDGDPRTAPPDEGLEGLDLAAKEQEIAAMKTLKVDPSKRVRIPDAKPGQLFEYARNGEHSFTLTLVKGETRERFPPGSLAKYFTAERNREEREILAGCIQGPK